MTKKSSRSHEITLRSSAAEYLTFVSAIGDQPESVELRYQDENIWAHTTSDGRTLWRGRAHNQRTHTKDLCRPRIRRGGNHPEFPDGLIMILRLLPRSVSLRRCKTNCTMRCISIRPLSLFMSVQMLLKNTWD